MKLLVGPPNSGKSERVISRVGEAVTGRRGRVYLVVPSARAAEVVRDRLAASLEAQSVGSPKQVVVTFPDLYTAILRERGIDLEWLGQVKRERLLRRVVARLKESGQLAYFGSIYDRAGLISALAEFTDELWRSRTDPAAFARAAGGRGPKDRDVALIFEHYQKALAEARAIDAEGAGLMALSAIQMIPARADRGSPPIRMIAADGFDFYTAVQVGLMSKLSSLGVEAIATLTYEQGRDVHLWQEPTLARFTGARAEIVACTAAPRTEIELAACGLMKDDVNSSLDDNSVVEAIQIVSAPDRAAEARFAAREVKRLVLERGYALDDIALVTRSLGQYAANLERVFAECSIPLAVDCLSPLAENPLVISLLRLLRLALDSFPRRACLECLRSPYFDLAAFGLDQNAVDSLDRLSLNENVLGGRGQWKEAIIATGERAVRHNDDDEEGPPAERRKLYNEYESKLDAFFHLVTPPRAATAKEMASAVNHILESLSVEGRLGQCDTSVRDTVALKSFKSLLDSIAADREPVDERTTWREFYGELERAVAASKCERADAARRGVVAQEAHSLRPRRFRAVFVLGLVEGEFPAATVERPVYTLVERDELRRSGIDITETPADAGADLTQFYKAMARASERLYLSYARTDIAGGELLPSYLVEEVRAVASAREITISQPASNAERLPARDVASLEELALVTARALRDSIRAGRVEQGRLDGETRAALRLLGSNLRSWPASLRGAVVEQGRLAAEGAGSFAGIIGGSLLDDLKRMFGPDHLWSASQINDYGICPFRFFGRHVLRFAPADEPVEGFLADRLGSAYHKILELLYAELHKRGIGVTAETASEAARIAALITEETLARMLAERRVRKSRLWEFEVSDIKQRLARLLRREAEWNGERRARPVEFEREFGRGDLPPLTLDCDGGEVKIGGVIDRIDEREDGYVVIDYKTGRTPIKHNEALDGRNLQLPIYMMAASRVVRQDEPVAAGYYLHINSRKKGSELPHKDDERLSVDGIIAHAEQLIRHYVKRVRAGQFPVRPNLRCPSYCEFETMCRIQSLRAPADEE